MNLSGSRTRLVPIDLICLENLMLAGEGIFALSSGLEERVVRGIPTRAQWRQKEGTWTCLAGPGLTAAAGTRTP